MIVQHSLYYVAARGVPGLINVAALSIYTRLLPIEEFGTYAAMIAVIYFADLSMFQWIRSIAARMLAAEGQEPKAFLSNILGLHSICAIMVGVTCLALAFVFSNPYEIYFIILGLAFLLIHTLFELTLVIAAANLVPSRYGALLASKSVITLVIGTTLALFGVGGAAPIWGALVGNVAALLLFARSTWRGVYPKYRSTVHLTKYLKYGLPLAIAFSLNWFTFGSDRLLIAFFLGGEAVGAYAAVTDLVQQSSTLLLIMINTAAFPLAVNALEYHGSEKASQQVAANGEIILAVAVSTAAGMICLAPAFVNVVLGHQFRADALRLIPYISVSAALSGIMAFHYNVAFHLSKQSLWLVINSLMAAILNVSLSLFLIPTYGIDGAAWAALLSVSLATLFSTVVGRRVFPMPSELLLLGKATLIALAVASTCSAAAEFSEHAVVNLAFGVAIGGGTFLLGAFALNLGQIRDVLPGLIESRARKL